jgi:hypothetical protein
VTAISSSISFTVQPQSERVNLVRASTSSKRSSTTLSSTGLIQSAVALAEVIWAMQRQ